MKRFIFLNGIIIVSSEKIKIEVMFSALATEKANGGLLKYQ